MVTSRQKRSADQAPNGINGGGVAGPFMPAWCLICAALLACLSPAPPTKSLDLSLTPTNNVIHVNDVPEHLLTMYPVCTQERVPTSHTRGHADTPPSTSAEILVILEDEHRFSLWLRTPGDILTYSDSCPIRLDPLKINR